MKHKDWLDSGNQLSQSSRKYKILIIPTNLKSNVGGIVRNAAVN